MSYFESDYLPNIQRINKACDAAFSLVLSTIENGQLDLDKLQQKLATHSPSFDPIGISTTSPLSKDASDPRQPIPQDDITTPFDALTKIGQTLEQIAGWKKNSRLPGTSTIYGASLSRLHAWKDYVVLQTAQAKFQPMADIEIDTSIPLLSGIPGDDVTELAHLIGALPITERFPTNFIADPNIDHPFNLPISTSGVLLVVSPNTDQTYRVGVSVRTEDIVSIADKLKKPPQY